jgi:hypothetical protein
MATPVLSILSLPVFPVLGEQIPLGMMFNPDPSFQGTLFRIGLTLSVLLGLTQMVGFGLCFFAPKFGAIRFFAITTLASALLCTLLSNAYSWEAWQSLQLVFGHVKDDSEVDTELSRHLAANTTTAKDEKERKKLLEDVGKLQTKKASEWQRAFWSGFRRLSFYMTAAFVANGAFLASAPLLLRGFCQALRLTSCEAKCGLLLKISCGVLAAHVVLWLSQQLLIMHLEDPTQMAIQLISVAWNIIYMLLLVRIWRAVRVRC